jgi:molybdopterin-binding protein
MAQSDQTNTKEFKINGLVLSVLTDSAPGPGYIMIRSEDITISDSPLRSSARNSFEGMIVDIIPAGVGVEVIMDIGVEIAALITAESVKMLGLDCGKKVWVSFKASAAKFIEG